MNAFWYGAWMAFADYPILGKLLRSRKPAKQNQGKLLQSRKPVKQEKEKAIDSLFTRIQQCTVRLEILSTAKAQTGSSQKSIPDYWNMPPPKISYVFAEPTPIPSLEILSSIHIAFQEDADGQSMTIHKPRCEADPPPLGHGVWTKCGEAGCYDQLTLWILGIQPFFCRKCWTLAEINAIRELRAQCKSELMAYQE